MAPDRRTFIKSASKISISVGCLGGALSLESCVANYLVAASESDDRITIEKALFKDETTAKLRPFVTVQSSKFKESIYLGGLQDENYLAVLLQCTHKGCSVRPSGDLLICPCHGSEFDRTGKVLKSPAEENLSQFRITYDERLVYIHFN